MTAPVYGWKAVGTDEKNRWLSACDPNGVVEDSDLGFNVGYFDVDGDGVKDDNEAIYFFKEVAVGANVYVLSLTPTPNSPGRFTVELKLKQANGTLTSVSPDSLNEPRFSDLKSRDWTLTAQSLSELSSLLGTWAEYAKTASNGTPPVDFKFGGLSFADGNSFYHPNGRDRSDRENWRQTGAAYNADKQGDPNQTHPGFAAIGGWGAWFRYYEELPGDYILQYRQLSAYECYEIALAGGATDEEIYSGSKQGWAGRNGVTINMVTVVIDGKATQTMGFSFQEHDTTYTFYWDPKEKCNKLGNVVNSEGKDITAAVLGFQTTTAFGRSLAEIKSQLVRTTGTGAGLGSYTNEGFTPQNTTGSVEAPTQAEIEKLASFKETWRLILDGNGCISTLPEDAASRTQLLDELQQLNPKHVLDLFTGGTRADGLDLLQRLVGSQVLTSAQAAKMAEIYGKIMFLVGRELTRHAGQQGEGHKAKLAFTTSLQAKLGSMVSAVTAQLRNQGADFFTIKEVLYRFMLGLRNYSASDGELRRSDLSPEQVVLNLIKQLAASGNMGSKNYSTDNANAVVSFIRQVVLSLAQFGAFKTLAFTSQNDLGAGASAHVLLGVATQEQLQKLLALAFGALKSYVPLSTGAQDVFTNAQKSSHEDSRTLQDALAKLYDRYWDVITEIIRQMTK